MMHFAISAKKQPGFTTIGAPLNSIVLIGFEYGVPASAPTGMLCVPRKIRRGVLVVAVANDAVSAVCIDTAVCPNASSNRSVVGVVATTAP